MEPGTRVKIIGETTHLAGREGVVVDEGYTYGTGTTVILDGEDESFFFSYKEMELINDD